MSTPASTNSPRRLVDSPGLVALLLALGVGAVYSSVVSNDFLLYDDNFFVVRNAAVRSGLNMKSVLWAFRSTSGFWFPLTNLSHMLDVTLWGLQPGGHHLTSLLLHVASTLLVFRIFQRLTGSLSQAAVIAALFGVHPVGVETVAWISERKGVLCGTLFLAAIDVYLGPGARRGSVRIAGAAALYLLALMAKPMALTLPAVLLLLDYWPLRTLGWRRVAEKIPMAIIGIAVSAITFFAQQKVNATADWSTFPFGMRLANALVSYVEYLGSAVAPVSLSPFYPHPYGTLLSWQPLASGGVLLAVTVAVVTLRKSRPHLLVGWLWWAGMLVPVCGLSQIGRWARADHYAYLPMLGLWLAVVTELHSLRWPQARLALRTLAIGAPLVFAAIAYQQVAWWHDTRTLFEHAAEVSAEPNWMAEQMLGSVEEREFRYDLAAQHLRAAIAALPKDPPMRAKLWVQLAAELDHLGGREAALAEIEQRALASPGDPIAQYELGAAYAAGGRWSDAAKRYRATLALDPGYQPAQERLSEAERSAAANPPHP